MTNYSSTLEITQCKKHPDAKTYMSARESVDSRTGVVRSELQARCDVCDAWLKTRRLP